MRERDHRRALPKHQEAALEHRRKNRLTAWRQSPRRARNRRRRPRLQSQRPVLRRRTSARNVGAFVLAGLDPHVGAEADFFADRVHYYDQGVMNREKIREDLKRYAERWPERRFWLDGDVTVETENGNRVRVTFPLRYELRNASKAWSGKIDKTLVLEPAGDDLEIVAVNERKAD